MEGERPRIERQEAEIERRLTTAEADIARGKTWDQIEAELDRRYS